MAKKQPKNPSKKDIRIAELEAQLTETRRLVDYLLRQERPNSDPKELIESILTGIAPLFIGYRDTEHKEQSVMSRVTQSFDNTDDVYFPDIEFDEHMEDPSRWPIPGMISTPTTTTPEPITLNGSYRIENGEIVRSDGAELFQAGATGPPPDFANE